jgi:acyl transferase domain-containing protein/NAD(P)-dependent dehydrogenase (short-subunit alcohol dehydrogenase family)
MTEERGLNPVEHCPLAIIGIGCLFPRAAGLSAYWSNITNRVDAVTDIPATHWRPEDYHDADPKAPDRIYTARGAFLDPVPFAPGEQGIAPRDLEAIDTSQLLGLVVAQQALEDAGYGPNSGKTFDRKRAAVILGVTGTLELVIPLGARLGHPLWRRALQEAGVPEEQARDVMQRIADSYVPWQENSFPGLLGNVVAGRIANRLDLGGTNCVVDAACASSLSSIHLAALELQTGRADLVLTGGVDTFNDIFMFTCFSKTPALSPTGNARPFDVAADGTILGEGLGMVVLKRLDDARRDGDRIYAVLRGIGSSSDGKGNAVYAPRAEGQIDALRTAYRVAGVTPDTIELVEAHGTGTCVGDQTEVNALVEVYQATGRAGSWCALGSVKSQIGHTKAAAGVAGLIKAVAALYHKVLPPTIKVTQPLDALQPVPSVANGSPTPPGPFQVNTEKRPWLPAPDHPRRAAVSAFGFGGSNFHAVLEEAGADKLEIDWDGRVQILAFAADAPAGIESQLEAFAAACGWEELCTRAARSRQEFQPHLPCRLLFVVQRDGPVIGRLLETARQQLRQRGEGRASWRSPEGIFYGSGPIEGSLAVLFPGQGAQYVGMLRDLACQMPAFHRTLAEAEPRLSACIYPPSVFRPADRQAQEAALRATEITQPALGAVSLGAWRVLEQFGVRADVAIGHSYGELPALCVSGRISPKDLHALSSLRGRLLGELSAQGSGAMLAVQAPLDMITTVLREEGLELTLANKNTPAQTVLSGPTQLIEQATEAFARRQVRTVRLQVGAAFHSPQVADARIPFRAALANIEFSPGQIPVVANSTARPYPDDPEAARELLASQLARPVEFVASIDYLYQSGCRAYLEVGPGARLTGMVAAILAGREHEVLALDASSGQRNGTFDLACCLAWLAARGQPIRLGDWDPRARTVSEPGKRPLTVMLSGANYVSPRTRDAGARPPVARPPVLPTRTVSPSSSPHGAQSPPMNGSSQPASPSPPRSLPTQPTPALGQALQITRESLLALQKMQEQTAQLHQKFLEGQEASQRTLQVLVEQQQRLLQISLGLAPAPTPIQTRSASEGKATPLAHPFRVGEPFAEPIVESPPPAPRADEERVARVLLEVIAEKTGYPVEMLELDMALDADLGIDSIKRVEILSALQERLPEAPAIKPEHLGTLHSLRHIAAFLANQPEALASSPQDGRPERVASILLEVIAEKTGYPVEMLELDMALDADLGIDSIKRVEILSALQERLPEAPAIKPEHLGTLHSLRHIAAFLAEQVDLPPRAAQGSRTNGSPASESVPLVPNSSHIIVKAIGLERGFVRAIPLEAAAARPMLPLPTGVEIWLSQDDAGLAELLEEHLQGRGYRPVRLSYDALARRASPSLLGGLVLFAPQRSPDDKMLRDALQVAQRASPGLRTAGRQSGAALLTVSRLDGSFGLNRIDLEREPIDGGLAGLAKTAQHEWPEVSCKAVDLANDLPPAEAAQAVLEELLRVGPVEVGVSADGLRTLERYIQPLPATTGSSPLQPGDVVVISGGARGVTAAVAEALARGIRPILVLLGRSPSPSPEPEWLTRLTTEIDIKRELGQRQNGSALRAVGEQYQQILAQREIRQTLKRIESSGARALYRTVDVRDAKAVAELLASLRRELGPIRGLIHGAGVLADARIEDKTPDQFDRVYATKVGGLRSLLSGLSLDDLRLLILFTSTTARVGRVGQVDYAMANEVLNKRAQQLARQLPACRVLSVNWGPWDGGMVTPALKRLFEQEGVGLIPLEAGAEYLLEEIRCSGEHSVEVVVLGASEASRNGRHAGMEPRTPDNDSSSPSVLPVAWEWRLERADYPVLESHVLDGRPVAPVALILEWLAHGALHQNPGLLFHGCNDLRVLHGVVLDEAAPPLLRIAAGKAVKRDGVYLAAVELTSVRASGKDILHARAEMVLTTALPTAPAPLERPTQSACWQGGSPESFYRDQLFHGPDLQGIKQVESCGEGGIAAVIRTAPPPGEWIRQPLRQKWMLDPLVIDGALQMLILWSLDQRQAPCLPCRIGSYRQYQRAYPAGPLRVVARVTRSSSLALTADVDILDGDEVVARLEDCENTINADLVRAFRRNRCTSPSLTQAALP